MSQAFDPFAGFELSHTAPSTRPQQEIWLAIKQGGLEASLAYNECLSLEISGPVDEALLREAWELLARRHESLRTCFTQDGQTLCIEKVPRITWRTEDWSGEDHYSQRKRLSQLLGREVASPFHLVTQSGFRVTWIDFGEERSEFILTAHHILCDGYSAGVLLSELCQVYTALSEGRAPALETAPKFSDYALAQKEALGSPESAEAERQWLKLLGESPETLDLPVDSQRPINRTFEARREDILLPRELLEGLRATAGRAGISLTAAFLAAASALALASAALVGSATVCAFKIAAENKQPAIILRNRFLFIKN